MAVKAHTPDPSEKLPPLVIFAAIAGLLLLAMLLWKYKHAEISDGLLLFAEAEVGVMAAVVSPVAPERANTLRRAKLQLAAMDRHTMTVPGLITIYNQISVLPRAVWTVMFLALAAWLWRRDLGRRYRGQQSLDQLIHRYKRHYPAINPVSQIDLMATDPDVGPWARPRSYIEFALKHKLIMTKQKVVPEREKAARFCGLVDAAKIREVLIDQLGPRFTSVEDLRPHEQFIFGVLAAAIARDKKGSDDALDQANRSCVMDKKTQTVKRIRYKAGIKLAMKYEDHDLVREVVESHAHVRVVLAKMLAVARDRSGVLTSSYFIWLKPTDRQLWYTLHQVGLRVPHVEATGPFAHAEIERLLSEPVVNPAIEAGVRGMILALKSEGWLHMQAKTVKGERTPNPEDEVGVQDALAPSTSETEAQ